MKILIVSTVGLIYDGITSVIREYIKAINCEGLELYIADTIRTEETVRRELESEGCTLVPLPSRRSATTAYFLKLARFIKREKIDIVHAHGNSATLTIELLAAWIGGCKRRIAHSHNTRCDQVRADRLLRPLFRRLYTDAVACGMEAGKWLFENKPFTVMNNGRDLELFGFQEQIRSAVRKEYGIGSRLAVGHVGGFVAQKNHAFLLEIYEALLLQKPDVCLFMIGDGSERAEIEAKAKALGIWERIHFTGNTDRIPALLQAMDVMVLPSLFEGLPLVSIEWQAAGLPCVLSDRITKECAVTDLVEFASLEEDADAWAKHIIRIASRKARQEQSENACIKIRQSGFDIRDNAAALRKLYLNTAKQE